MQKYKNFPEQTFNMLTVLSKDTTNTKSSIKFWCKCKCGTIKSIYGTALRSGGTKSCGCWKKEIGALRFKTMDRSNTHGFYGTKTYRAWAAMKTRCNGRSEKDFKSYKGKGITVCPEWQSFQSFLDDMGIKPDGLSLDRINNNLGYYKENCRWATNRQQLYNRSCNRWVTVLGETLLLVDAIEKYNIVSYDIARQRIRAGWTDEKAVLTAKTKI